MPSTPKKPELLELSPLRVAEPVQGQTIAKWNHGLQYLLGTNLESVYAGQLANPISSLKGVTPAVTLSASFSASFLYQKSPYCDTLYLEFDLWPTPTASVSASSCWINLLLPTSASYFGTSLFNSASDFSRRLLPYSDFTIRVPSVQNEFINVRDMSSSSIQRFTIVINNYVNVTSSTNGYGIRRLTVSEVPRGMIDPYLSASTSPGVNQNWTLPTQRIYQGSTSGSSGFVRMFDQLDKARTQVRKHWQQCGYTDPQRVAFVSSSLISTDEHINWQLNSNETIRTGIMKLTNLYGSDSSPYKFAIYYCNGNSSDWKITLYSRPHGSSAAYTGQQVSLAPTGNAYALVTSDVTLENNTSYNSEVEFYFMAQYPAKGKFLYIGNLALIEQLT